MAAAEVGNNNDCKDLLDLRCYSTMCSKTGSCYSVTCPKNQKVDFYFVHFETKINKEVSKIQIAFLDLKFLEVYFDFIST